MRLAVVVVVDGDVCVRYRIFRVVHSLWSSMLLASLKEVVGFNRTVSFRGGARSGPRVVEILCLSSPGAVSLVNRVGCV